MRPALWAVREAFTELRDEGELADEGHRRPALDQLGQRLTSDVFHRDERLLVVLADVVDGDDVRVLQPPGGARLPHEAVAHVVGVFDAQEFEGDEPIDWGSSARYTTPMPPWPRRPRTSNRPIEAGCAGILNPSGGVVKGQNFTSHVGGASHYTQQAARR